MFHNAIVGVDDVDAGVRAVALAQDLGAGGLTLAGGDAATLAAVRDAAGVAAETLVHGGHGAARALERAAREHGADLLVLGPRTDGQLAQLVRRRDAGRAALHHACCPIAVVRPGGRPGVPRTVAAGYDGSAQSRAAVHAASAWCEEQGAALTVYVAWPTPALPMTPGAPVSLMPDAAREAQERLDDLLAELPGRTAGRVVHGAPNAELVKASATVDLIVVGSGQVGPLTRALLGSTADWVMHHAECPVLVVPRGATEQDAPPPAAPADPLAVQGV
jgi:nucleotide-binding universal stress UspA family protein